VRRKGGEGVSIRLETPRRENAEHPRESEIRVPPGLKFLLRRDACHRSCLVGFLAKNNGRQGLHIMVPIEAEMAWNAAHDYTREIAESLAATAPGKYTTSAAFSARPGKLFVDYLRNGRGTTAIGAYSPRARPGFPVAAPVTWRDLEHGVRPGDFTTAHPPRRARRRRPS
jgi:DNA primase